MTIYIGNPSKQRRMFYYRIGFGPEFAMQTLPFEEIGSGKQVVIGAGWKQETTNAVIDQLRAQGALDAAEIQGRITGFQGLVYRENFQIEADEIEMAHAAVVETQEQRSATQATRSALAFDRAANMQSRGRVARMTGVEVEQLLTPNQQPTGNEVRFGIQVDPQGQTDARLPV